MNWIILFFLLLSCVHADESFVNEEFKSLRELKYLDLREVGDLNLVRKNEELNLDSLLLVVIGKDSVLENGLNNKATFLVMRKYNGKYKTINRFENVYVGRNGFGRPKKIEGDGKTPVGIFQVGEMFTNVSRYPELIGVMDSLNEMGKFCGKRYITDEDSLSCYDGIVNEIRRVGDTIRYMPDDFKGNDYIDSLGIVRKFYGGERLSFKLYRRCALINYNYGPGRDPEGGSAILLHFDDERHRTAGCVALADDDMEKLFRTIYPGCHIILAADLDQARELKRKLGVKSGDF